MSLTPTEDAIARIIDPILEAHERMVRREIKQAECLTTFGCVALQWAQDKYEETYSSAIREILRVIADARSGQ